MALKPPNVSWLGFTKEQAELLDFLDYVGNNGWDRNGQTEELMPNVLAQVEQAGLTLAQVKEALKSIGYDLKNSAPARPLGIQAHHGQIWPLTA